MERFPTLERPRLAEQLLDYAKAHALPYDPQRDTAEAIGHKIELLQSEPGDHTRDVQSLMRTINESTVTVQTMEEFEKLIEKVSLNDTHQAQVLKKGIEHSNMAQKLGVHHEGYSLIVYKDRDDFRYKAFASYSYPENHVAAPIEIRPKEILTIDSPENIRKKRDTEKIALLRNEIGRHIRTDTVQ